MIALRLGDCLGPSGLGAMPDDFVDHVITDPPYCSHVHAKHGTERRTDGYRPQTLDFAALTPERVAVLAQQFLRVSRRWVIVFTSDRGLGYWIDGFGDAYVRTAVWVKPNAMPQITGDRPAQGAEFIAIAHRKGRKRWSGGGRAGIYTGGSNGDGRLTHPTQKPLWLMESILREFTDRGETVLDPFAGAGTTLFAAKRMGRDGIGYEVDPKYHALAEARLATVREQLDLAGT